MERLRPHSRLILVNPSLKVARPGWSTTTAPDWALVFNSDWPSLQIAFETTYTTSNEEQINHTFTHNLGFPPLVMAWISTPSINYGRLTSQAITIDPTNVSILMGINTFGTAITITIRCYNIDISKEAVYPLPTSAAGQTAPDLTTGIKIAKTGRNINSKNLNDFILNSQAQSPAILNVATQNGKYYNYNSETNVASIVYPLQTSFIPWAVGAIDLGGNTFTYYDITDLQYDPTNNTLSLSLALTGAGSLIILRDPLFYPNTVRVVY